VQDTGGIWEQLAPNPLLVTVSHAGVEQRVGVSCDCDVLSLDL
jgi:hypothetical protein